MRKTAIFCALVLLAALASCRPANGIDPESVSFSEPVTISEENGLIFAEVTYEILPSGAGVNPDYVQFICPRVVKSQDSFAGAGMTEKNGRTGTITCVRAGSDPITLTGEMRYGYGSDIGYSLGQFSVTI